MVKSDFNVTYNIFKNKKILTFFYRGGGVI